MRRHLPVVLCLLGFASPVAAQAPRPAPELAAFDKAVGNWTGTGTFRATADGQAVPWTSTGTLRRTLGGHVVEEDIRVDLGQASPLVYRVVYVADTHTRKLTSFSFSNTGFGGSADVSWSADGKRLIGSTSRVEEGVPVVERWVTTYSGDGGALLIERSVDGGAFYKQVEGRFRRGGDGFDTASASTRPLAPVANEMKILEKEVGTWKVRGTVSIMAGMEPMAVSATQSTSAILGGHVNLCLLRGDPAPDAPMRYEGRVYSTWDPAANCYANLSVDNFGMWVLERGYDIGPGKMVYTSTSLPFGVPHANRSVVEWSADGNKYTVYTDRAAADASPDRSFEGQIERVRTDGTSPDAKE